MVVSGPHSSGVISAAPSVHSEHIRKRKLTAHDQTRPTIVSASGMTSSRRNVNKLIKFKNATLNWLNGLPPTDYDSALYDFQADNEGERENFSGDNHRNGAAGDGGKDAKFKGKLANLKKKLFRNSGKNKPTNFEESDGLILDEGGFEEENDYEKLGKVQNLEETQFLEVRSNVREIFLPPDVAGQRKFMRNLTPKMRKKFAETHPWTVSNEIRTAKYTIFNFIPKNLFEQFRRVANVYFFLVIILQGIPIFSNTNIILAASPLVSILLVTAIKDAVEDWKRQKSDNLVNNSLVAVLDRSDEDPEAEAAMTNNESRNINIWTRVRNLFPKKNRLNRSNRSSRTSIEAGWKMAFWKDIRVGDIVKIRNNESIPADIVVLSTSNPQGICYVETKNLDGETNLKIRQAPRKTAELLSAEELIKLNAVLQVEPPSTKLYTFNGKMILPTETAAPASESQMLDAEAFPITPDNLLLRGCQIRNTEFVTGVVAYTGPHSKIIMNSGRTPSKRSRIEKQMNPQIILSFVLLLVICLTCAIMQGQYVGGSIAQAPYWYTVYKTGAMGSPIFTGFLTFWSSLILFQTLVPISLYITVEICKLVQAAWIHWDIKMYYPERDQRAVPRSWNIADDLGQIEYIFSDKTGTLTRNVMEFRMCSIGGKVYGHLPEAKKGAKKSFNNSESKRTVSRDQFDAMEAKMEECLAQVLSYKYVPPSQMSFVDPALLTDLLKADSKGQSEKIREFFFAVIVCHTILIDKLGMTEEALEQNDQTDHRTTAPHLLQYQAQSPDEAALVKAARDLGFVFLGRDQDVLNLSILGKREQVQVLSVIEFNSTRKRMSLVIKKADGRISLISKGADSVIYERLKGRGEDLGAIENLKHLEEFAESGLRTLCFASRPLEVEEFESFSFRHSQAAMSMHNREMMMDAVAEEYERNLNLLGSSAIEDRLQDGVPETISNLQLAGIKIWVLTGDKMETAVNIGFSCKLLTRKMFLIMIKSDDSTVEGTRKQLDEGFRKMSAASMPLNDDYEEAVEGPEYAYNNNPVGDFAAKDYALIIDGTSLKHALEDRQCRPVFLDIATNCKAVLCCRVSPLQKAKCVELIKKTRNVMTLAIGDGANDVSMIQEADVGIGIAGEEGMQAVMSSDYAVAQFSHLERLLLVHGRLSYVRTAKITLLSFCKNVSFVLVAFWFQIYCAFTAQYTYDYMYLLYFNIFFTMLPVMLLGIFDQQVSNDRLQQVPQLYRDGIKQTYYSMKLFLIYSFVAIYQSLICYFLPQLIFTDTAVIYYGFPENKTMIGNVQAFAIILTINCFTAAHMEHWNLFFIAGMVITGLVFLGFVVVYLVVPFSDMYASWGDFMTVPFWAAFILTFVAASTPTFLFPFVRGWIWPKQPTDIEIVREIEIETRKLKKKSKGAQREGDVENGEMFRVNNNDIDNINNHSNHSNHNNRNDRNDEGIRQFTLEDELIETVRLDRERSSNENELNDQTSANNIKWTLRGHKDVSIPEKALPVLRAEGSHRLRTLTTSSNEFIAPEMESGSFMMDVPLEDSIYGDEGTKKEQQQQQQQQHHRSKGVLGRSSTLKRIGKTFRLFNLRTGKMEKFSGFAFAQESGSGRTINTKEGEENERLRRESTEIVKPQPALIKK